MGDNAPFSLTNDLKNTLDDSRVFRGLVIFIFFFSAVSSRGTEVQKEGRMSYADFVWLLISEEDKRSATR